MEEQTVSGIQKHKFLLWLSMGSMTMLFAALTSALIVKMNNDIANWVPFKLPSGFLISTILVVCGSVSLHAAYISFKKHRTALYRSLLLLTIFLCFGFFGAQWYGLTQMQEIGMFLSGSASGGFVYAISLIHGTHIAIGLVCLVIYFVLMLTAKGKFENKLQALFEKRRLQFEMLLTFWHYIGLVWVYLYILFITIYK